MNPVSTITTAAEPTDVAAWQMLVQPSGDTTGATDVINITSAISAMTPTGGVVQLGPGTFYIKSTITVPMQSNLGQGGYPVSLIGNYGATVIQPVSGCTPAISAHRTAMWGPTQNNSPNPMLLGSRLADFVIDGQNTSGATGLDVGDCWGIEVQDVMVKNFTGAGAIGLHQANRKDWSEKCRFRLTCINCTDCVVVDSPAGNISHEYNDWDLYLYMLPGQNGITWQNGAFQGGGRVFIRGNHNPSTGTGAPAGSVITVTGHDGNGHWSQLYNVEFDVVLESNSSSSSSTGSDGPTMVSLGYPGNGVAGFGQIVAQFGGWSPSVLNGGTFKFTGRLHGDAGLATTMNPPPAPPNGTPVTNNGNDAIVCVNGGSVSKIIVNGVTTGLTSGTFYVCQDGTIQIDYSSAPGWAWYPNCK